MDDFILMVVSPIIEVIVQSYVIEVKKIYINHTAVAILRGIVITGFVFLQGFGLLLLLPLYWVIFQYGLNAIRSKPAQHLSVSSWFDLQLLKIDAVIGYRKRIILHILLALVFSCLNLLI